MKLLATAVIALFAALATLSAANASGPGEAHLTDTIYLGEGRMTYAAFEAAVPHVDIAGCPAQFDPDAVFCRMTLNAELAHVFVFAHDGDQPLLVIKSYGLDDGFLPF